jgi:short-chain fatty acids transporter
MAILISRFGLGISRVFRAVCPDPFVIAILLTIVTAALAIVFGSFEGSDRSLASRSLALLDAWRGETGLWRLLAFGMQMCLVLVTGHALASTRQVRALVDRLASVPRSGAGGAVLVCLVACLTGLLNWGLALVVGALMAREVGASLARRGIAVHYPLLAAAGYMGLLVFHGGLSASAPLSVTSEAAARKVLQDSAVPLIGGGIPLDQTLLAPLNLFVTGGLIVLLPVLFRLLTPHDPARMVAPIVAEAEAISTIAEPIPEGLPDRLDRSPWIAWLLALAIALGVARYGFKSGVATIGLNEVNMAMLALGLVLHASPRRYMAAVEEGARDCGAIIIQFPIYAGIMAMMSASGLVRRIAEWFTHQGDAQTMPVYSFLAATLVGLFVPSGGAQWGLQGEVALRSGIEVGADPGAMVMSVAYGDELANMLQPFWALPLLAITGVRARDVVGYTAVAMLVAGAWMALGLWLF